MQESLKHGDITQRIIGCAMKVHSQMRNGYNEIIYAKCLEIEFQKEGINYRKEAELAIYYDDQIVGRRKVDFMIEDKVIVELKALSDLTDQHLAQTLNYLESHRLEIGLLINFGAKSLQFKRVINTQRMTPQKNPTNPNLNPTNPRS